MSCLFLSKQAAFATKQTAISLIFVEVDKQFYNQLTTCIFHEHVSPNCLQDVEMRRGKPLYLNEERYAALTHMVKMEMFVFIDRLSYASGVLKPL